jgi:hypothetical protein
LIYPIKYRAIGPENALYLLDRVKNGGVVAIEMLPDLWEG